MALRAHLNTLYHLKKDLEPRFGVLDQITCVAVKAMATCSATKVEGVCMSNLKCLQHVATSSI